MDDHSEAIRVLLLAGDSDRSEQIAAGLRYDSPSLTVEICTDLAAVRQSLENDSFDCLLIHVGSAPGQGIDWLESIRSGHPDIPAIVTTESRSEEGVREALHAGAMDVVSISLDGGRHRLLTHRTVTVVEYDRLVRGVDEPIADVVEDASPGDGPEFGTSVRDESGRRTTSTEADTLPSTYKELFDKAEDGIVLTDPSSGTVMEVNDRFAEMVGYEHEELRDMTIEAISADDPSFNQAAAMGRIQEALEGDPQQFDWLLKRADGTQLWTEVNLKRVSLGGTASLLAFVRDITHRKARERELEFFEAMVESIGVGVAAYGSDGRFAYVNEAYANILETDREQLETTAVWDVVPDLDEDQFEAYWHSFESGETRTTETIQAFDDTEIIVETVTTCTDIAGEQYHFGTVQDISDRKEQEVRFQAFVEQSNDIISVLDETGTYEYQSPSVERILGYESEELLGESAFDYVHPDDREAVFNAFERAQEEDDGEVLVVEFRFQHADGSWRWLESRGFNQPDDPEANRFVVNSRDITERKRYERLIGELHESTREMVEATGEHQVCKIAIETVESLLEHPIGGIWLYDETEEHLEPVATTGEATDRFGEHPVYAPGNSLAWDAFSTGETMIIDDIEAISGEYNPETMMRSELIIPIGEFGVLNIGSPDVSAFSENDVALAKLLSANTLVALGRAERERQLERQTDQMEFFNSILRHDVLNAITVIKARAEFLEAELDGEQLRDAQTIIEWSEDVTDIVQRVRTVLETLTGEGDPELNPVSLDAELQPEIDRVRMTYPDVSFETEVPEDTVVLANDLLGDVLGNIITNAVDHNDSTDLQVSVSVARSTNWVAVRVADTGSGISDDRKEAVFRRGETGHAKSIGSGFGLFFVDVMVSEYGGDVWVEDNDAGGATVVVKLPRAEQGVVP